jgi:hypothetical protein
MVVGRYAAIRALCFSACGSVGTVTIRSIPRGSGCVASGKSGCGDATNRAAPAFESVGLLTFLPPGETASPVDDLAPLPGGAFSCGSSARCATNFAARR